MPDNIIASCRLSGLSAQDAFDAAAALLQERYDCWNEAEASLPSWGRRIDPQVKAYVDGIKSVVKANLYWRSVENPCSIFDAHRPRSFRTDRYLGRDPETVRATREISVLRDPPFLQTNFPSRESSPPLSDDSSRLNARCLTSVMDGKDAFPPSFDTKKPSPGMPETVSLSLCE